jgi:hypothetical protein
MKRNKKSALYYDDKDKQIQYDPLLGLPILTGGIKVDKKASILGRFLHEILLFSPYPALELPQYNGSIRHRAINLLFWIHWVMSYFKVIFFLPIVYFLTSKEFWWELFNNQLVYELFYPYLKDINIWNYTWDEVTIESAQLYLLTLFSMIFAIGGSVTYTVLLSALAFKDKLIRHRPMPIKLENLPNQSEQRKMLLVEFLLVFFLTVFAVSFIFFDLALDIRSHYENGKTVGILTRIGGFDPSIVGIMTLCGWLTFWQLLFTAVFLNITRQKIDFYH